VAATRERRARAWAVSPFLAWVGSPCLRHCVHGASIGGGRGPDLGRAAAMMPPRPHSARPQLGWGGGAGHPRPASAGPKKRLVASAGHRRSFDPKESEMEERYRVQLHHIQDQIRQERLVTPGACSQLTFSTDVLN
jgi:hypothetical protein